MAVMVPGAGILGHDTGSRLRQTPALRSDEQLADVAVVRWRAFRSWNTGCTAQRQPYLKARITVVAGVRHARQPLSPAEAAEDRDLSLGQVLDASATEEHRHVVTLMPRRERRFLERKVSWTHPPVP
jgi:hypothetical protein